MFGFFMQFAFVIVGPLTLIAALVYALLSPVEPLESVGVRRPT
jgi:hypothetical protein